MLHWGVSAWSKQPQLPTPSFALGWTKPVNRFDRCFYNGWPLILSPTLPFPIHEPPSLWSYTIILMHCCWWDINVFLFLWNECKIVRKIDMGLLSSWVEVSINIFPQRYVVSVTSSFIQEQTMEENAYKEIPTYIKCAWLSIQWIRFYLGDLSADMEYNIHDHF